MDFDDASAFAALALPRALAAARKHRRGIESRVMMVGLQISALPAMRAYAARNFAGQTGAPHRVCSKLAIALPLHNSDCATANRGLNPDNNNNDR